MALPEKKRRKPARQKISSGVLHETGSPIPYTVFRDRRAKHWKLRWSHRDELTVTIPWRGKPEGVQRLLDQKLEWIRECQVKSRNLHTQHDTPRFYPGGQLMYRGQMIPIVLSDLKTDKDAVRLENDRMILPVCDHDPSLIEMRIMAWLRKHSHDIIKAEVTRISEIMGIPVKRCGIRNQKRRWGSWSTRGHISLNWRLIMAPPNVLEYIIIHELTHHHHPNHSKNFWQAVARHCPTWKKSRDWLKKHTHLLF